MDVALDRSTSAGASDVPWLETHASPFYNHTSKHTPNRVRAKPAKPQVISSILTSLEDTLAPLPASDHYSDKDGGRLLHTDSSSRSVAGSASVTHHVSSPGFGVEYGRSLDLDDEEGVSDAALPPTIPTSRPPSVRSNRTSKRLSWSKSTPKTSLRAHATSRRSSLSTSSPTRPSSAKHKLSSESWVRRNDERPELDDWSSISRGRTPHRSVRRITSQKVLHPTQLAPLSTPFGEPQPPSLAEQIIARSPPSKLSSKGRLYLTDATIAEKQYREESPPSPVLVVEPIPAHSPPRSPSPSPAPEPSNLGDYAKVTSEEHLVVREMPTKASSPITDSIPTRTSSLRLSSNSPAPGKRTSKKSKRHTIAHGRSEKMKIKKAGPIPDSSWADLGEDDETVKRIKQLREQRKSRLQEHTSDSRLPDRDATDGQSDRKSGPVYELSAPLPDELTLATQGRPTASRATTEPNHSLQSLKLAGGAISSSGMIDSKRAAKPAENNRNTDRASDAQRPYSAHARPTTSKSETYAAQPVSLDYSYVEAVQVLDGLQKRGAIGNDGHGQESSERKRASFRFPEEGVVSHPQKKQSRKSNRFSFHHPDLPLDFDKKKGRRQSMSDARLARAMEEEEALARKNSIEEAVMDYLNAPRLNRKLQHPTTGRIIAFSEVGDPNGAAVLICVGMGLTRYVTAFYDELATTLRLRLITLDRPGVGASEPFPPADKSGPLNWPEDVVAVCQHLGIANFSILAHSAGAIYALATALTLPHLVKGKVHLLAPWVPPSQLDAISHPAASAPPTNALPRSQRFLRVLPTPFLKVANSSFMTATSTSLQPASKRTIKSNAGKTSPRKTAGPTEVPQRPMSQDRPEYNRRESMMLMDQYMPSTTPLDNYPLPVRPLEGNDVDPRQGSLVLSATATPADPSFSYATAGLNAAEHAERERQVEYTSRLTQHTWDLATRNSNPATDLLVCLERHRDVGFQYTDVGREVVITHGSDDKRVPVANVRWLAEQMNRRARSMSLDATPPESRESYTNASSATGGCEVRILEGEGHGLMASPVIMGDVLTEIAGYWIRQDKSRA